MQEFGTLAQALMDMVSIHNAWITMGILYGGCLVAGMAVGKVVCAIDERLGAGVAIIASLSIIRLYAESGGMALYPIAWPPAWIGWGVLFVYGRKLYSDIIK